jgi:nucleoid-associated protein YgaU
MGILDNLKNVLGSRRKGEADAAAAAPGEAPGEPGSERAEGRLTGAESAAAASAAPEPAAAARAPAEASTYTVQSGDTLWKIAREHYGDGALYLKIFEANRDVLEHPDRIFPGQELTLPPQD